MYQNPIQKRVLTVQDFSCFGKCSGTVALPILSAMGHETVLLPTAVLSTHTGGFTGYTVRDLTDDISPISHHFASEGIVFDCIYTGYLCKGRQVSLVASLVEEHKRQGCLFIADPAMADGGKYYFGFDDEHARDMLTLCRCADVITPNVTEAAFLLGEGYPKDGIYTVDYAKRLIEGLRTLGCRSVILTSVSAEGNYGLLGYDHLSNQYFDYFHERVGSALHGSGDTFTSVLVGRLLSGDSLEAASHYAADFVRDCVLATEPYRAEHPYGLLFETQLGRLCQAAKK
jgi:pyridoxine kinase